MKVETHNHPTAISPLPGASTGAGGEIRDEGAHRARLRPKAGLTGFTVSKLWGGAVRPARRQARHIASPLQIMTEGPLAAPRSTTSFQPAQPGRATSANTSRPWPAWRAATTSPS